MCFSRTDLPSPLRPMMTRVSPLLDGEVQLVEHLLGAEALAHPLQGDAVEAGRIVEA